MKIKFLFLIVCTFFGSLSIFAGVSPKNGNFYISYTDIVVKPKKAGFENISRTYNSMATEIGIFGYGWGSDIETRLFAFPDGTLMVKENGTGMNIYYTSIFTTDDMLEYMIDQLIDASLESGDIKNVPSEILARRQKYANNQEIRNAHWLKYIKKGLVNQEVDFPIDMEWESNKNGNELIVKTEDGYKRTGAKVIEDFDANGNMIRYDKGNGYYTSIEYIGNRISKMINADGSELIFTSNSNGFITSITLGDEVSLYTYNGNNLVETKDNVGNLFKHTYNKNHDMTSIIYIDNSSRIMTYQPKTHKITSVTDREGFKVEYDYLVFYNDDGSINKDHFGTKITKNHYGSPDITIYEYIEGTRVNGNRFNKMFKKVVNGEKTETHYDELCGRPISIEKENLKTTFKYNNRCLLIEKNSAAGDSIYLEYHPDFEKITKVTNNGFTSEYAYNETGLLTYAKSKNSGDWVKLTYDANGNIVLMTLKELELSFKYNELNKPSEILITGKEKVTYTYDTNGDILKVDSDGDTDVLTLEITKGYQTLFALVKPARVNLEM